MKKAAVQKLCHYFEHSPPERNATVMLAMRLYHFIIDFLVFFFYQFIVSPDQNSQNHHSVF